MDPLDPIEESKRLETRRQFLGRSAGYYGLGVAALASLLESGSAQAQGSAAALPELQPRGGINEGLSTAKSILELQIPT